MATVSHAVTIIHRDWIAPGVTVLASLTSVIVTVVALVLTHLQSRHSADLAAEQAKRVSDSASEQARQTREVAEWQTAITEEEYKLKLFDRRLTAWRAFDHAAEELFALTEKSDLPDGPPPDDLVQSQSRLDIAIQEISFLFEGDDLNAVYDLRATLETYHNRLIARERDRLWFETLPPHTPASYIAPSETKG